MGAQAAGGTADQMAKQTKLTNMLEQVEGRLKKLESEAPPFSPPPRSRAGDIRVVIGTSEQASDPAMVERLMTMVNTSYYESMKDFLHPRQKTYERLSRGEVIDRLEMGDAGIRANRVLHIAYRGDTLQPSSVVGCMSSTYQPPWTEEGCGHWGLLVVDKDEQGKGIASVLVRAAELRLAGVCEQIQIEYEYTPGHAYSERLLQFYEGSLGFQCVNGYNRRPGMGTQFRKCRKQVSAELSHRGELLRLQQLRTVLTSELIALKDQCPSTDASDGVARDDCKLEAALQDSSDEEETDASGMSPSS